MNPQPEPYIGNIFATLFACLFIYYTLKALNQRVAHNDLFVIGYVEDSNNIINNFHVTNVEKRMDPELQKLYNDCIEALRALGMKKSEATRKTKQVFENSDPVPQNVQDFLMIALRKQ